MDGLLSQRSKVFLSPQIVSSDLWREPCESALVVERSGGYSEHWLKDDHEYPGPPHESMGYRKWLVRKDGSNGLEQVWEEGRSGWSYWIAVSSKHASILQFYLNLFGTSHFLICVTVICLRGWWPLNCEIPDGKVHAVCFSVFHVPSMEHSTYYFSIGVCLMNKCLNFTEARIQWQVWYWT